MKESATFLCLLLLFVSSALAQTQRSVKYPPRADHHQHLISPAMAEPQKIAPITAEDVVKHLDDAGIRRAVLLSVAYMYGRPGREPQDEYARVKETNDWLGAEAAQFSNRLIAFCGFNPLKDYALDELNRCAKIPSLSRGIKLHFGNSDVRLEDPAHIEKLKAIFRAANANRMAIVVHMRASISLDRPYGAEQARAFLEHLMPLATNITVQIAHLAGSGPGYDDPKADAALEALIEAIAGRDPRTRNLWFDITASAHPTNSPERSALLAKRIRQVGVKRILFGADAAIDPNLRPRESWAEFCKLDLTDREIKTIASNQPPYLR